MQYSPKLKRAIEQIKKILKDNEIAGFVAIHTPGHAEYLLEITPPYSCAEWNATKDSIIVKGKLVHYNGDKEKRDKKLTDTINMLSCLSEVTGQNALNLLQVSKQADEVWDAEHTGGGHTSHNQQNN